MNAAQALAIAAAAYAMGMGGSLSAPFELALGGIECIVERLETLGDQQLHGPPGFRTIPDAGCMERWTAMW